MKVIASTLAALVAVVAIVPATLAGNGGFGHDKPPICHRTASDSNPYVIVRPAKPSYQSHLSHLDPAHYGHPDKHGRHDFFAYEWRDGSFRCTEEPPVRFDPRIRIRVCGDPWLLLTINNRRSNVPVTYRFYFTNGRGASRTFAATIPAGGRDVLMPRWVKARSMVGYTVRAPGVYTTGSIKEFRLPRATHWGDGSCPRNLDAARRIASVK